MGKLIKDTLYPVEPKWLKERLTKFLLGRMRLKDTPKNRAAVREMTMDQIHVRDFIYEVLREHGPSTN